MDYNATIDVGKNITSMLERLAAQIGTTADKVFPWYVQQAYLEGITTIVCLAVFLVASALTAILCSYKLDWRSPSPRAIATIISVFVLFFTVMGIAIEGVEAVRKIYNPNYYAMTMMTRDIGRLVAK